MLPRLSGFRVGMTSMWTLPAVDTAKVRMLPEPLRVAPLTLYVTPLASAALAPELSVPIVTTRSKWKVGAGDVQPCL